MFNLELDFPEIFLSLAIMFLLILGVFKDNSSKLILNISLIILIITSVITFNETLGIKKNSSKLIQNISLVILLITSVITLNETLGIQETLLFNSSIVIDYL